MSNVAALIAMSAEANVRLREDNKRLTQALAKAEAEAERLRGAVIAALGTYDTALSAATFTKPRAGQVVLNVKTVERLNETLRAALSHPKGADDGK